MKSSSSTLVIHMVSSLDGFIAKHDGSVSWFETSDYYDGGLDDEDPDKFLSTIDCFVIGARTYDLALKLGWPYGDVPTIVVTHGNPLVERKNVELYSGDLRLLVNEKLKTVYRNIWVGGGPSLISELINANLADEIRLSILPVVLGDGIRFFDYVADEQALHLKEVTAYKTGMVELWYEIKNKLVQTF